MWKEEIVWRGEGKQKIEFKRKGGRKLWDKDNGCNANGRRVWRKRMGMEGYVGKGGVLKEMKERKWVSESWQNHQHIPDIMLFGSRLLCWNQSKLVAVHWPRSSPKNLFAAVWKPGQVENLDQAGVKLPSSKFQLMLEWANWKVQVHCIYWKHGWCLKHCLFHAAATLVPPVVQEFSLSSSSEDLIVYNIPSMPACLVKSLKGHLGEIHVFVGLAGLG